MSILDNTNGAFTDWFEGDLASIARLSGAPRGSTVTISWADNGFALSAVGKNIEGEMFRMVMQREGVALPSLFIYNNAFVLPAGLRRKKLGVRSIAIELIEAQKTGHFAYVEVVAIGNATTLNTSNPKDEYSGYVVWPQIGFDGPIPAPVLARYPELSAFSGVRSVLQSPGGRDIWMEKGDSCRLQFDLTPNSESWLALSRYMLDNHIEVKR